MMKPLTEGDRQGQMRSHIDGTTSVPWRLVAVKFRWSYAIHWVAVWLGIGFSIGRWIAKVKHSLLM